MQTQTLMIIINDFVIERFHNILFVAALFYLKKIKYNNILVGQTLYYLYLQQLYNFLFCFFNKKGVAGGNLEKFLISLLSVVRSLCHIFITLIKCYTLF